MIPGNHRTPRDLEDDMYEGLVTKDPEEIDGANATSEKSSENSGIAKRVLRKLSGGAV